MNKNLKKVISAASALAVSASGIAAFAATYPDVPNTADYYQAVSELSALGIIAGFDDGTFKPDENVTRAQITKMVVTALGSQVASAADAAAGKDTKFTDVPGTHWAAGFVSVGTTSAAQNFINGYSATSFGPEDNVTYAQAIKMLVAALGYSSLAEGAGGWPSGYLNYGYRLGLTTGLSNIGNDQQLNRGQVAILIDNALKCPVCVTTGNVTYDRYGNQIPVTLPKDGTGDLDGSKDGYQNLLNYAHDAYLVYGRVTGTFKSGDSGLDTDEVRFNVEKSDNWDGYPINAAKDDNADSIPVYKGQVTDADNYLFTYSEAIVKRDINDEYTLVSLTPYGASEKIELNTGDYKQLREGTKDDYQLQMYKDGGRSKYDTYKIVADAGLYVNGREVSDNIQGLFDGTYVKGNKVGKVTLIDSTDEGKSSTDGKYDYVMVSYYVDGVIDEVDIDTDEIVISLDNPCDPAIDRGEIVLDLEDEDKDYNIILDDAEIEASELQPGDVVSVAYDVTNSFKSSDTYDIIVSRAQVEDRVSSIYEDDEDQLDNEYTLDDGNIYKLAFKDAAKLENGVSYKLYLDDFGKIVKAEELASTKKYGLLENVYMTNGNANAYADVVIGDGTKQSYEIDSKDYDDFVKILMANEGAMGTDDQIKNRKAPENRVIEYTTTTKGIIKLKSDSAVEGDAFDGEYKSETGKLGKRQLTDALSSLIDITEYEDDRSQAYSKVAIDSLDAGTTYTGYAYGKIGSDNVYQFVLIKSGIGGWNVNNPWAVFVQSSSVNTDNGDRNAVVVYTDNTDKPETIPVENEEQDGLKAGDVFFYHLNSDNEIDEIKLVASIGTDYQTYYENALKSNFDVIDEDTRAAFRSPTFSKDDKVKDEDCDLISGPIVDISGSTVYIATEKTNYKFDANATENDSFSIEDATDYEIASDAKYFVYDYEEGTVRNRVYPSSNKNCIKASKFDRDSYLDRDNDIVDFEAELEYIKANSTNSNYGNVYFAVAKVVDEEITEILVIQPSGDDE